MNIIESAARRFFFTGYYGYSKVAIPIIYKRSFKRGELRYLSKEDFSVWKQSMLSMLKEYCFAGHGLRLTQVIYTFANARIEVIRKTSPCSSENPIVILCVKNDLRRIQMLVEHYRSLGVEKFAFMDNGSDDGTFEWLLEQPDIDLYRCLERYQTKVKEGWINRIISHYGFDRWYVVTDSDELMVYQGMEQSSLSELTKKLSHKGVKRVKGLTLDTYTDGNMFGESEDIRRDYRWIDKDSYREAEAVLGKERFKYFIGGPRYRLMHATVSLSKHPLVYWERGTISDDAHFQYPHDLINTSPCYAGILHYKFIDKDLDEFNRRARKKSGFAAGGLYYKKYMDYFRDRKDAGFMYEGSIEFDSSKALEKIHLIKTVDF